MTTAIASLTAAFGAFLAWIVYLADTRQGCFFFDLVKATPCGDKIGHFLLFGILTFGANLVLRNGCCRLGAIPLPYGALAVFALVVVEELSQVFFPHRTVDGGDILADLAGILLLGCLSLAPPIHGFFPGAGRSPAHGNHRNHGNHG